MTTSMGWEEDALGVYLSIDGRCVRVKRIAIVRVEFSVSWIMDGGCLPDWTRGHAMAFGRLRKRRDSLACGRSRVTRREVEWAEN